MDVMSEQKPPARPRQVTMAVVTAVVGGLVLIMSLFDTLGRLRTPESREASDGFPAAPPGSGLGVDTAQVIGAIRRLAFVSGALAAALLVFAVYLLQRHKGARIGFTVVAGLLLLTIPVAGLMPVLVAVGAVLLWTRPARDWYAGRAPAAPAAVAPAGPPPSLFSEQDPAPPAPPTDATTTPPPAPVPYGGPVGQPPPYVPLGPSAWP